VKNTTISKDLSLIYLVAVFQASQRIGNAGLLIIVTDFSLPRHVLG
jgi:hypothetical protein